MDSVVVVAVVVAAVVLGVFKCTHKVLTKSCFYYK